ncbi:MAG TPA: primosomal protein N' [Mycobacteriales bacterium]|nr:primosomal protein N' [Mycobacteriales bacterium]
MPARRSRPEVKEPAERDPVARVVVDVPLAHLDRPFDYLVPTTLDDAVVPGSRVRVRFAGQLVDAIVLDRVGTTEHEGRLSYVERAVSAEPVLSAEVARLARAVADRWAGSLTDVLRLALPPRHARVEAEPPHPPAAPAPAESGEPGAPFPPAPGQPAQPAHPGRLAAAKTPPGDGWARYPAGRPLLRALADSRGPRAVWAALPGEDWPARLAELAAIALAAGRGALLVVPDRTDLDRVDAALTTALGPHRHVALSADLGPAERYRRWLAVRRGTVRVVAGTRAAAFAPVADLGLVAIWDDGDDLHAEPRAPYPHARDLLVLRAHLTGAAALLGGHVRTAEAQQLLATGWAREIVAERAQVRSAAPRVTAAGDDAELVRDPGARSARLPTLAWRTARETLAAGAPVLVQVPRRGYLPALACAQCRGPARCGTCSGPLAAGSGGAIPACRWCGHLAANWRCPTCAGMALRAVVIGAARTAEELGRAFPGVPVRSSMGESVLASVPAEPALVVATPGAEPRAEGGYGAALLLDGWALLTRPDLRTAEEALRRWANAAALVRPAAAGGRVVVGADAGLPVVQALVRWDPAGFAERELAERAELRFPPAARFASITGAPAAVADLAGSAHLPAMTEQLGPVPAGDGVERLLLRVPPADGAALARTLRDAAAVRSARKAPDAVRIQLDPLELF